MKLCNNWQDHWGSPAVIEFPNHMIFQGAFHDKSNFSPVFLKNWNLNAGKYDYSAGSLMMKNSWMKPSLNGNLAPSLNYVGNGNTKPQHIWKSKYENEIVFFTLFRHYLTNYPSIFRYNYETDQIIRRFEYPYASHGSTYIVDEDDQYYYTIMKTADSYNTSYVGYVKKDTLQVSNELSFQYSHITFLTSTNTHIWYVACEGNSLSRIKLYAFEKAAKRSITISPAYIQGSSPVTGQNIVTSVKEESPNKFSFYYFGQGSVAWDCKKITFDTLNLTQTVEDVTFDYGSLSSSEETPKISSGASWVNVIHSFRISDTHIALAVHNNAQSNSIPTTQTGVYIFEIDPTDNKKLKYINKLTTSSYLRGIFNISDNYTQMAFITDTFTDIYRWNNINKEYQKVYSLGMPVISIGVDEMDRLWVVNSYYETHLFAEYAPATVNISTETPNYTWTGENINTNLIIDTYNIDGTKIATKVKLLINGDVTFTNDSKIKTVTTSATETTYVPIIIKGPSFVKINASIEV